jgi:hypothetical protein
VNFTREHFLLVLLVKGVVSQTLMSRIFALGAAFTDPKTAGEPASGPILGTYEDFVLKRSIASILPVSSTSDLPDSLLMKRAASDIVT